MWNRRYRPTAGVSSAHVDLMAHRASVEFDPAVTAPQQLVDAVRGAGYDAVLPRAGVDTGEQARERDAASEWRAWTALCAGALAMVLAMPLGGAMGAFDRAMMRMLPWLYALPQDGLRWFLLIVTAAAMGWAGRGIYLSALRGLRHRTTNMNTLVSLGTGVAFAYSAYATIWPAPGRQVYFDAVLLILGFLLLGKALEARAKRRALAALDALARLKPATARRVRDGVETIVALEEIEPGDQVLVLPGERFPVDATIAAGRTTVDESMLTGESEPLAREAGGRVLAGSLNYDGAVTCKAESLGEATVLAQITRMVEQAQSSRAPMERLADRASAIFVPVVLGLAAVTFVAWMVVGHSLPLALANTVAVLVIACPCAMGLAVPAALTVAVGRGAQLGILFKGGEALERLAHLDVVVVDKTGTLTVGRPVLVGIHPLMGHAEDELLRLAAAVEMRSNHPLAHALVDEAEARGLQSEAAVDVQNLPGRGLTAKVEGLDCVLGNEALFHEFYIPLPKDVEPAGPGVTRLWMALNHCRWDISTRAMRCGRMRRRRCRNCVRWGRNGHARADADRGPGDGGDADCAGGRDRRGAGGAGPGGEADADPVVAAERVESGDGGRRDQRCGGTGAGRCGHRDGNGRGAGAGGRRRAAAARDAGSDSGGAEAGAGHPAGDETEPGVGGGV